MLQNNFASIFQAAHELINHRDRTSLPERIAESVLQYSGADRCVLSWASAEGDWQTIERSSVARFDATMPAVLIQYVRDQQITVIDNAGQHSLPVADDYFQINQPESLLCLPILHREKLVGTVYLEHQLMANWFNPDRMAAVSFLCMQGAIALENDRIEQALQDARGQIAQHEKMATLGNLVAGIAHEINNPLSFLSGSTENALVYIQQIFAHVTLYQEHYPDAAEVIQANAAAIDLAFIQDDFPRLLQSMLGANERIQMISKSLRSFARSDMEARVKADLCEGLDSTLLILKYRLKATLYRPGIGIATNYNYIPLISCFPGQLNQVFMNILANAIDVFDEIAEAAGFDAITPDSQRIMIEAGFSSDQSAIEIWIRDNGCGMPEEIRQRIFDDRFTTKAVGKGTGLGLAIARQIVVEVHGGELLVESTLGEGTAFCIRLPIQSELTEN